MIIRTRVLRHLLETRDREQSIRQIAQATKTDYKNTYLAVKGLVREKAVSVEQFGHSKRVRLARLSPALMAAEVESREALLADKGLAVMLDQLMRDLGTSLSVLLLFGSYAKKTQRKGSDIDLMLIVPDGGEEQSEKKLHVSLSLLPLPVHVLVFSESQFRRMLSSEGQNVVKQAVACAVILHNIESYYQMITHDR